MTASRQNRECFPCLDQSPVAEDFVQNPYPFYARARALGDFFWWNDYDRVCASSYRAVNGLLRDRRWGREIPARLRPPVPDHLRPFMEIEADSMLEIDPPRHTALRNLVHRAFTPRQINALAPRIKDLADRTAADLGKGEIDVLSAFANRIPVIVIARLLGVPDSMADQLLAWSHDMVAMYQARRNLGIEVKAAKAASEFSAYIENLARKRAIQPAGRPCFRADKGGDRWQAPDFGGSHEYVHPAAQRGPRSDGSHARQRRENDPGALQRMCTYPSGTLFGRDNLGNRRGDPSP